MVPKENEKILNIFKLTDLTLSRERRKKDESEGRAHTLPKNINDLLISRVKIDTCIIVTNVAVYKVVIK